MENTVEIYQEEKELRGKRLAAYAESIQEKVQYTNIGVRPYEIPIK